MMKLHEHGQFLETTSPAEIHRLICVICRRVRANHGSWQGNKNDSAMGCHPRFEPTVCPECIDARVKRAFASL
jgi:hypothetical protein